jgi:hypothetical protein
VVRLLVAYLGGMLASIPAFAMFDHVGASPFRNFAVAQDAVGTSLSAVLFYFALIWAVPAVGSTFGAKLAGHPAGFRYMYGRGLGGQFAFSIGFSLLIMAVASFGAWVMGLPAPMQTLAFLAFSQLGCTLGTVWGL